MSKQLLPVYDKPMIYYPLSILMLAGIREMLIISTPEDLPRFAGLLGDGTRLGVRLNYRNKRAARDRAGVRHRRRLHRRRRVCLILGDNLFYGHGARGVLKRAVPRQGRHDLRLSGARPGTVRRGGI